MAANSLMSIGLKLIGIYFLALGLMMIPQILSTYEIAYSGNYKHPLILIASTIVYIIIMLIVGLLLAIKTEKACSVFLKNTEKNQLEFNSLKMSNVIQLMGVFIAGSSLGSFVKGFLEFLTIESLITLSISATIPDLISILIGIIFVYKGNIIAKFLDDKNK